MTRLLQCVKTKEILGDLENIDAKFMEKIEKAMVLFIKYQEKTHPEVGQCEPLSILWYLKMKKAGAKLYKGQVWGFFEKEFVEHFWVENKGMVYTQSINLLTKERCRKIIPKEIHNILSKTKDVELVDEEYIYDNIKASLTLQDLYKDKYAELKII